MNNQNNLRIAHIMAGAVNGGAELFFERLCIAQYLQNLSILPIIRKNFERKKKLINAGLKPLELNKALKEFSPKVAVAWMNRAASFMPKGAWINVGRLGGFYDLKYYRQCDHLVGNTKKIVEWIKNQGWPGDRVHYIPKIHDRVHMPGWIKDISNVIMACDILVCSSRHEPLGNIVLEGFSATKPVVALAAQGPMELIVHGINGLLTPLEDEKALANAITFLIDNPSLSYEIAIAGHQKLENEFSQEIVLQKWYDFLTKIEKT